MNFCDSSCFSGDEKELVDDGSEFEAVPYKTTPCFNYFKCVYVFILNAKSYHILLF